MLYLWFITHVIKLSEFLNSQKRSKSSRLKWSKPTEQTVQFDKAGQGTKLTEKDLAANRQSKNGTLLVP